MSDKIFYTQKEMNNFSDELIDLCYYNYVDKSNNNSGVTKDMKISKLKDRVYRIENNIVKIHDIVIDIDANIYRVVKLNHRKSYTELPSLELYRMDGKYVMASKILHKIKPLIYHKSVSKEYRDKLDKFCLLANHFILDDIMLSLGDIFVFDDAYAQRLIDAPKYEVYKRKEQPSILKKEDYGTRTDEYGN
jgi:hypothetical protein